MGSDVVLSAGVRQNLLALQNTAQLMATTQTRLATGKRVNRALDNPVNFFTSASLSSRAKDLTALLDGMANGIKTIEAADNGINGIKSTIESMKSTLLQARQDKSFKSAAYTVNSLAIGTTLAKNLSISGGAVTGTVNIALNTIGVGGTQASVTTSGAFTQPTVARKALYTAQNVYAAPAGPEALTITFTPASGSPVSSVDVTLDTTEGTLQEAIDKINAAILLDADANGVIRAEDDGTGKLRISTINNVDGAVTVTGAGETNVFGTETTQTGSDGQTQFTVNGTTVTLTNADSPTLATAINTTNLQLQSASSAFEAYDAGGGLLGIREITAQGATLTIGGADAGLFGAVTPGTAGSGGSVLTVDQIVAAINSDVNLTDKVTASNDSGLLRITNLSTTDLTLTGITGTAIDGGIGTASVGGNTVRRNLVRQYNDLRDQLNKIADDSSYNGVNLLRGDKLKINFNEYGTSTIVVQAKDEFGVPRPINTITLGIDFLLDQAVDNDTNIDGFLDVLNTSLNILRSQASSFGSNLSTVQIRTEFTKQMVNTLEVGADNLVLADVNEEGANMLALQTRQQLSTTALSLASQADQAVLRLFG
jgi:flagellin-like hook-associated protein FlgL